MQTFQRFKDRVTKELLLAEASRTQGNEGRARVCARRAVGVAISWYYASRGGTVQDKDAIDLMKQLIADSAFPSAIQQAVFRLSARITPDFQYPASTDAIADAKLIIDYIEKHNAV